MVSRPVVILGHTAAPDALERLARAFELVLRAAARGHDDPTWERGQDAEAEAGQAGDGKEVDEP